MDQRPEAPSLRGTAIFAALHVVVRLLGSPTEGVSSRDRHSNERAEIPNKLQV